MIDDNFPTDTKAPRPIKGTIWAKGQVQDPRLRSSYKVAGSITGKLPKAEGPTGGQTLPKAQALETIAEVAERLRLEARAGHRKYKGPNVFQHLLRRTPKSEAKPEVKSEAARNLAMMMTPKGKITRAN